MVYNFVGSDDKLISPAVDSLYKLLALAVIPDCLTRRLDVITQRSVGNDSPRPDIFEQLISRNQSLPIGDQILQQIQHLRFNSDRASATHELKALSIKLKISESINHLYKSQTTEEFRSSLRLADFYTKAVICLSSLRKY
jgi:hypothetical protein